MKGLNLFDPASYSLLKIWQKQLISVSLMLLLCAVVFFFNIPNPNMILISCLVITTALFGWHEGTVSAVIMFVYSLFFFSVDHSFVSYTAVNLQKLAVILIGELLVLIFVGRLKQSHDETVRELRELNELLSADNKNLAEASMVDTLTGLRNRFALRRDYQDYVHRELIVMMMDADDFKHFNDDYGHDVGDYVLGEIGVNLTKVFGADCCYRYGGDEFLVLFEGSDLDSFREKLRELERLMNEVTLDGTEFPIPISGGYVYGTSQVPTDLRSMIHEADMQLYSAKSAGKRRFSGRAFRHNIQPV